MSDTLLARAEKFIRTADWAEAVCLVRALRDAVLDVHDALHRQCDGTADLPAEIRALRDQRDACEAQVAELREALGRITGTRTISEARGVAAAVLLATCGHCVVTCAGNFEPHEYEPGICRDPEAAP